VNDTIFHKIIERKIPATIVYETERLIAIRDINPVSPVHILIIPKVDIQNAAAVEERHALIVGELVVAARVVAEQEGILESGYRLVFNVGEHGQETVPQLHLHLIGGRQLEWPPG